jgi:hypothetical protein
MSLWLIGDVGVRKMKSLWTIFFSIVRLLGTYEMFYSINSGCLGLGLNEELTYMSIGGLLIVLRMFLCGRLCLCVCCGILKGN